MPMQTAKQNASAVSMSNSTSAPLVARANLVSARKTSPNVRSAYVNAAAGPGTKLVLPPAPRKVPQRWPARRSAMTS